MGLFYVVKKYLYLRLLPRNGLRSFRFTFILDVDGGGV
jgi:hypothetical protein